MYKKKIKFPSLNRIVKIFSAPLSGVAEKRAVPAAFSLAETVKDPVSKMTTACHSLVGEPDEL